MKTLLFAVLFLAGCATGGAVVDDSGRVACKAFRPITYSVLRDTVETVQQVREHNAAYKAVCKGEYK